MHDGRAASLDGWRTLELKALPVFFFIKAATLFTIIEQGAPWPQSFFDVPQSFLRKNKTHSPLAGRFIGVISVWHVIYNKHRFVDFAQWRSEWTPSVSVGARAGCGIQDVYWDVQFHIEVAGAWQLDNAALLIDRDREPHSA